jgi:hypothetical protein
MRACDVTNWRTFREWVIQYRSPKRASYFSDYFFSELQAILTRLAPASVDQLHLDVSVERVALTDLAGPNQDRLKRLESYDFLHENAWKVYIYMQAITGKPVVDFKKETATYYGVFLKDKTGKLVYFRAYDPDKGMPLWSMRALAKQLTKE